MHGEVVEKAASGIRKKCVRLDLRVHRLCEGVSKGETEHERAEIVDISDPAKAVAKRAFGGQMYLFAALVHMRISDAAVEDAEIVEIHKGILAGPGAELA